LKTALLLLAVVAAAGQSAPPSNPPSNPPKPAPAVYVSTQFGLAVQVPKGLSYCPLPKNWTGIEDGTVLFITAPADCIDKPASFSSTRLISGFAPSIAVRYRKNAGRADNFDDIPPAESSLQLASQVCAKPEVSSQFKLFGQPAVSCRSELSGGQVRLVLLSLYASGRHLLLLDLRTTKERLAADSKVLESVAEAVAVCNAAPKNNASEKAAACPNGKAW
jgi:hypothetical protein